MLLSLLLKSEPVIHWIKVEKPKLDLIGIILGAFALTGLLAVAALVLGAVLGVTLIRRRARQETAHTASLDLHAVGSVDVAQT